MQFSAISNAGTAGWIISRDTGAAIKNVHSDSVACDVVVLFGAGICFEEAKRVCCIILVAIIQHRRRWQHLNSSITCTSCGDGLFIAASRIVSGWILAAVQWALEAHVSMQTDT